MTMNVSDDHVVAYLDQIIDFASYRFGWRPGHHSRWSHGADFDIILDGDMAYLRILR